MKFSSTFKVTLLTLFLTLSLSADPIAIANGNICFPRMVTTFIFDGEAPITYSENYYASAFTRIYTNAIDEGYEEGTYSVITPNTQAVSTLSKKDGYSFQLSSTGNPDFETGVEASFNRYFDVSNLKEITVEYDCTTSIWMETGAYEYAYASTLAYAILWSPDLDILSEYYHNYWEYSWDGGIKQNYVPDHMYLHYTFDDSYSGIIGLAGHVDAYVMTRSYAPVPECATGTLIFSGLLCGSGFYIHRRKKIRVF